MAGSEDVAMRGYRLVRRKLNARLAKANREGQLEQELEKVEQLALMWWAQQETPAINRRNAK